MNREIAVVAFAQTDHRRTSEELSEVEMLMPVLHEVLAQTGLKTADIDFTCSGSSDYLAGRAFSFTLALDGVGPGRRSPSRTSRWTAPGRCTRRGPSC